VANQVDIQIPTQHRVDRAAAESSSPPVNPDAIEIVERAAEEVETLHASVKAGTVAQIVVAIIATIGLVYLLKLVLVTVLAAMLIAYVLEPVVAGMTRLRIPRSVGSLLAVIAGVILAAGICYFSYSRALDFTNELPRFTAALRDNLGSIRAKVDKLADQARSVVEPKSRQKPIPVQIEQPQGVTRVIPKTARPSRMRFWRQGSFHFWSISCLLLRNMSTSAPSGSFRKSIVCWRTALSETSP
jgi:hypothetical protein